MLSIFLLCLLFATFVYELLAPKTFRKLHQGGTLFAKMTPGAIVSEVRGKIAATVFGRNRGGAVIRNRIKPINRRSDTQQSRRQSLAALASQFRGLTAGQILAWNAAAQNFPVQDSLGQTILLTGEQLYVRFNANILLVGGTPIANPPNPVSFAEIAFTSLTADASDGTISVAFTPTVPAGYALVFRASRPLSAGKRFIGESEFRFIQAAPASATSPQALGSNYVLVHGAITNAVGLNIWVEFFLVHVASGIAGQPVRGFGTIVP